MNTNTFPTTGPKKPSRFKSIAKKGWPVALAAVIGVGVGGAVVGYDESAVGKRVADPEPKVITETVTPEPEVVTEEVTVEVADPTCRKVAEELFSMLQTFNEDIAVPYSDVVLTLIDQLQYGADAPTIEGATATLDGITASTEGLTGRIETIRPDYVTCSAGSGEEGTA